MNCGAGASTLATLVHVDFITAVRVSSGVCMILKFICFNHLKGKSFAQILSPWI